MRKTFMAGLLVAVCALAYVGCDNQGETVTPLTATTSPSEPSGLKMPDGTAFEEAVENGKPVLRFTLPQGYTLLATTEGGGTTELNQGGIKCTCEAGTGGCSPFRGGNIVGCAVDPDRCTTCTATVTRSAPSGGDESFQFRDVVLLDKRQPVAMVETQAQAERLSCGSGVLLSDPEIVAALGRAVQPFQGPDPSKVRMASIENAIDDVLMAPFNVYGHVIWAPVAAMLDTPEAASLPTSELVWNRYMKAGDGASEGNLAPGGGAGRCHCRSGSSGCSRSSRWTPWGQVEWCEAGGCDSCELT